MRLFTSLFSFGLLATVVAQSNCDLIQSVTLTVPNDSQYIGYVNVIQSVGQIAMDLDEWQYIAITKDSQNNGKIYKNGQLVVQGNFLNVSYSWNRIDLGAVFFTSYSAWFSGDIDEIRLSNVVRDAASINSNYISDLPFTQDANTIGLWSFNQASGATISSTVGSSGTQTNSAWNLSGRFGQCLSFDGISSRAVLNQSVPTANMTIEFWIKPTSFQYSVPLSLYGFNTASFTTDLDVTNYTWSTGATGTSVTVDPSTLPYVWVTDGSCTDTVWFNGSQIDTVLVTVTDTLLINTIITGVNPPNNTNTIRVYPNPAMDQVTVDFGNFGLMSGYSFRITNSIGQVVYLSPITQQSVMLPLGGWGGPGLYFVELRNPQGIAVDTRHIILQ